MLLSLVLVGLVLMAVAWAYASSGAQTPAGPWRLAWEQGSVVWATQLFACDLVRALPAPAAALPLFGAELILLLIWAYYGVAIMRLDAVEYAAGLRTEVSSATAWARRQYGAAVGSILVLLVVAGVLGVGVAYVGLIAANVLSALVLLVGVLATGVAAAVCTDRAHSRWAGLGVGLVGLAITVVAAALLARGGIRIPYVGEVLAGLLSPLAFASGGLMVVLLLWVAFGSPLMFGTLATAESDVFEAWSRSFHYIVTHPWRYLFLFLVWVGYGLACLAFVWAVRVGTEWLTVSALAGGLLGDSGAVLFPWGARLILPDTGGADVLRVFLNINRVALDLLVFSFWASFKCAAMTLLYFLMRRAADGTAVTEVHLEPRDRELLEPPAAEPS
jgi:hypothetical protein